MWQGLIVGVLVLASAGYTVWALTPARSRPRLAARVARWLGRGPAPLARLGERIERAASNTAASGCGACPQSRIKDPSREASAPRR